MKVKVRATYDWILYPKDFEKVKAADFTIGTFTVKEVLEGKESGLQKGKSLTAKGALLPKTREEVGVVFLLEGEYAKDSMGRSSLSVTMVETATPTNEQETIAFLSCGVIKGVGKKIAKKMWDRFGSQVLTVIENEPEKLAEVPGITEAKAKSISDGYRNKGSDIHKFIGTLKQYSIPEEIAVKAYEVLGAERMTLLDQSIYHMVNRRLMTFQQVEQIARRNPGFDPKDRIRIEKAIMSVLYQEELGGRLVEHSGNLFTPYEEVMTLSMRLLGLAEDDFYCVFDTLKDMHKKSMIYWEEKPQNVIYRFETYDAEREASELVARQIRKPQYERENLAKELEKECLNRGFDLGDQQKAAVLMALQQPFSVITGFPGTGKTTIQMVILTLLERVYGHKAVLLAPTGRASKRMTEQTNHLAQTIHSALSLTDDMEYFGYESKPRIDTDMLIVDEASMMDIFLFRALMKFTRAKRICIIGDIDQLPSVGCGCVLKDLIDTPLVSLTRLTRIYRQDRIAGIVENAMHIRNGEYVIKLDHEVHFTEASDERIVPLVCATYKRMVEKYGQDNVILLSPYRRNGSLCTNVLNKTLQSQMNPDDGQKVWHRRRDSDDVFRIGDPILLMKNMTEKEVVNGDVGTCTKIEDDGIVVNFEGKDVKFIKEEIQYLDLSYATTVHKSQGSEYKCVILIMSNSMKLLASRSVFYTAESRARTEIYIFGQMDNIAYAISKVDNYQRKSRMTKRIAEAVHRQEQLTTPPQTEKKRKPEPQTDRQISLADINSLTPY